MGVSVMCGFLGSYLGFRFGSEVLAGDEGIEDMNSGLIAKWPAAGWLEGMLMYRRLYQVNEQSDAL